MKNGLQARMTRNASLITFMEDNADKFADNPAFQALLVKLKADSAKAVAASVAAAADNTGYSAEKMLAKKTVCAEAAELCASSIVKLDLLENQIVSKSIHGTVSYYFSQADAMCGSRLMNAYKVMHDNLALITDEYLTAYQLATFLSNITKFTGLSGSTSSVNGSASVLTKTFEDDMKVTNANVLTVKLLAKKYKRSDVTFYNLLIKACKIPAITIRHTPVIFNITNTETTGVVAGVEGTLSKSKEVLVSNIGGVLQYSSVLAGAAIGTFKKTGFITKIVTVDIMQGKTNTYSVSLTPGVMTAAQETAIKVTLTEAIAAEKAIIVAKAKARKEAKAAAKLAASQAVELVVSD